MTDEEWASFISSAGIRGLCHISYIHCISEAQAYTTGGTESGCQLQARKETFFFFILQLQIKTLQMTILGREEARKKKGREEGEGGRKLNMWLCDVF